MDRGLGELELPEMLVVLVARAVLVFHCSVEREKSRPMALRNEIIISVSID